MVETVTDDDFTKKLDILAGIDAWQVIDGTGIRGIASRVQWPKNRSGKPTYEAFESFTIRESLASGGRTELGKKLDAINNGFLYPQYTAQAYIGVMHEGPILYICVMDTKLLFEYIKKYPQELGHVVNPIDGNIFAVAWIKNIRCHGYLVQYHKPILNTAEWRKFD